MSSIADLQARLSVRVAATNEALMGLASIDDGKRTPKKWVINEVLRLRGKAVEATSEERLEYARIDELRVQQIEQLRKEVETLKRGKNTNISDECSGALLTLKKLMDSVRDAHVDDDATDTDGEATGAIAAMNALMRKLFTGDPLRDIICATDPVIRALGWYMDGFKARGRQIEQLRVENEAQREENAHLRRLKKRGGHQGKRDPGTRARAAPGHVRAAPAGRRHGEGPA